MARDRPELSRRQRLNALIGTHEPAQHFGIEAAVGVSDEGPCHAEHPRKAGERTSGQLRQLPVVAGRQIVADLADLLFDEVIVVEQPLGGRSDRTAFPDRGGGGGAEPTRCPSGDRRGIARLSVTR